MGVYLYAILPAGHSPAAALTGVDDAPVRALDAGEFTLWVSTMQRIPAASVDRIRRHNQVVEAAMRDVTPVPVRFGQWLESEDALLRAIGENARTHRDALEKVRDAVEFGVRIIDPALAMAASDTAPDRSSGTAYLQSVAREIAGRSRLGPRAQEVADSLDVELAPLVRARRAEPLPSTHGLLSIAHLVGRHDISRYRKTLDSFRARTEDLQFLVSGPWPPYSFAG